MKPNKNAAMSIINEIYQEKQLFTAREVRDELARRGYIFGENEVLIDYAEIDMTNKLIGQLTDSRGKRLYVSTQLTLDFGVDYVYRKAEDIKNVLKQEEYSTSWLQKQMISLVRRTPLLPDWAIEKIVNVIKEVFTDIRKAG